MKTRKKLNEILAANTDNPYERLERDTERDHWLDAEESLEYGLVDKIMKNADDRK